MNTTKKRSEHLKKLVCIALFCALAYIVSFCFPIKVSFLTFDAKDSIIAVGGMFFGPVAALVMSVVVPLLEFLSVSDTGIYGLIMNFLSSAAFSVTASLVYKYRRRISGAVIGLLAAVVTTTGVMMIANLFITPFYMSVPREDVALMIPTLLLPFNLIKTVLNSALVLLLYKPITKALRATKLVPASKETGRHSTAVTVVTVICAAILLVVSVILYITVMGGSFSIFNKDIFPLDFFSRI